MMMRPELKYYDMDPAVVAFSTTRRGGCSAGSYAAFNINSYCGDAPEAVRRNREALCRELRVADDRLLMPHQTHQTVLAVVDEPLLSLSAEARQARLEGIDALTTDLPGVCIGVSTADCIPLLLYDPVHRAACAVHAGWRGTVARIAVEAVRTMTRVYATRPADLKAVIGPGISLESFEVGQEVYDAFAQAAFDMPAISRLIGGRWHIDLPECNRRQLIASGLQPRRISLAAVCTYQHCDDFFSARRLGIRSGRIFTGILILTP